MNQMCTCFACHCGDFWARTLFTYHVRMSISQQNNMASLQWIFVAITVLQWTLTLPPPAPLLIYWFKPWPNGLASRRKSTGKFAKPELRTHGWPNGFASRLASRKKPYISRISLINAFYNNRLLAINLCRLALGGQTVKNLRLLASKFGWPNETQVQNLRRLASPFGQGFTLVIIRLDLARNTKLNILLCCLDSN